jgi:hypothetical protein
MMSLEHAVSRAVMRARLMERALHSAGDWMISVGDVVMPANRTILDDRIVFSAMFTEKTTDAVQMLVHDDVPLSVRPFTAPDFAPFIVDWTISVADVPAVA